MNFERPSSSEASPKPIAELFSTESHTWESVKDEILELEELCFPGKGFGEEYLQEHFENPESIIALLKKESRVVGFSYAIPDEDIEGAVYIDTTEIHPDEQGKGYVVSLISMIESEARARGWKYITRNAVVDNCYAMKIEKNYEGRILESYRNESEYGPQCYFKIAL